MSIEVGTRVYVNDHEGVSGTGVVAGRHPANRGILAVEFKDSDDACFNGDKDKDHIRVRLHDCRGMCEVGWWIPLKSLKVVSSRLTNLIKSHAKKHNLKVET